MTPSSIGMRIYEAGILWWCLWHGSFCYALLSFALSMGRLDSFVHSNAHTTRSAVMQSGVGKIVKKVDVIYNYTTLARHRALGKFSNTVDYVCVRVTYSRVKYNEVLNGNKRRWMEQKTTVKHDNVISNQRGEETEEKKQTLYPNNDGNGWIVVVILPDESSHSKAKLNLLCLVWPHIRSGGIGSVLSEIKARHRAN